MRLAHLTLTDFRNFASLQTEVPPGPTIIVGANAQGKTSLLEAVNYLVSASSPHASHDSQLIRLGVKPRIARLVAEMDRMDAKENIEIRLVMGFMENGQERFRKEILVNGVKKRAMDLHGRFNAVLFLPQDVQVVEGSPGQRRRELDSVISQADPDYAHLLSEYGKVLSQRNALLKQLQERRGDSSELSFWDKRLAELGAEVMLARASALAQLQTLAAPIHGELTGDSELLTIHYQPAYEPGGSFDEGAWLTGSLREGLESELKRLRSNELRRGMTLTGPQRDDLSLSVNELELRLYGSRGQNRTAMLAFKLAQVEWLFHRTGEQPVLLLDEVLAELDPERRSYLLEQLTDSNQALLTAADIGMFDERFLEGANRWMIKAGSLSSGGPSLP
jgi:DNA replication and repair protein RecF